MNKKFHKCRICKSPYVKRSMGHVACGGECAQKVVEIAKDKALRLMLKNERAELAKRKEAAQPIKKKLKSTEKVINTYVRLRDARHGCISCDKPSHWDGNWHASHFKSVGSNSVLRYNLWNINKGCNECNLFLSGNIVEYERRLILKIGAERVEWLKAQNGIKKYDGEYLDRLKAVYARKTKRLLKRKSS